MTNKLIILNSFVMPAEDETFEVTVSDTKSLAPNCWLWNESVGYLEVVKYSLYNNIVTVKNLGRRENAKRGTEFPTCMEFLITAPTALDPYNPLSTCLAADFNSPTVGQEAYMSVGSTYVIKVDDQIIVGGDYRYAVTQVVNATTLKVRNEGLGKEGIIEAGCDSCVPVQVVSKLNCCPIPSGDLTSNTSVLTVNNGYDVLLDNASLTLDTDLSKYDNSTSEFITLTDVPRGTLSSLSTLIGVTGGSNNVLGNITLSLDTDLSKYDNSISNFITVGDIPRGELYSSTNILTVNNGYNNVLGNIELVIDTDLSKYNNITSGFITLGDIPRGTLSSSTNILTVTGGTNNVLDNISLTLDTDLSNYDNTTSSFISSSDKKNLISTSPILTVNNGTGAALENVSLTLNTDLSQYDNSVSQFVTAGGLPSGYIISNTSVLSVSGGSGATLTNVSLTLDTDLSQYDNTTSGFITGISNLSDIGDVTLTSLQDGDVLTYDANSGEWINSTGGGGIYLPLSGGTMTGDIKVSGSHRLGDTTQAWITVYTGQVISDSNTLFVGGNSASAFYLIPTATATTNYLGSSSNSWEEAYIDEFNASTGNTNVNFKCNVFPTTDNFYSLGDTTKAWKYVYVNELRPGQSNLGVIRANSLIPVLSSDTLGTGVDYWKKLFIHNISLDGDITVLSDDVNSIGTYSARFGFVYSRNFFLNQNNGIYADQNTGEFMLQWHSDSANANRTVWFTDDSFSPFLDNTIELGNSNAYWANVYSKKIQFSPNCIIQGRVANGEFIQFSWQNTVTNSTAYIQFIDDCFRGRSSDGSKIACGTAALPWSVVYADNGTIQPSDIKLKENIELLEGALKKINALNIYEYTWKKDVKTINYGVIAQEAIDIVPEAVTVNTDENGDPILGVYTSNILYLAVKAIQELSSKVDELNAKIKVLEGRL